MSSITLLIGTFVGGPGGGMDSKAGPSKSEGIYSVSFDTENGKFLADSFQLCMKENISPSFLRWHPKELPMLYSTNETIGGDYSAGSVATYSVSVGSSGNVRLELVNRLSSQGSSPCCIGLHPNGTYLAAANYAGDAKESGSVAVMSLDISSGALLECTDFVQHAPANEPSIVAHRGQNLQPHAHSAFFDKSGKWLLVGDVGTDRLYVYAFEQSTGKIKLHHEAVVSAGGGVRNIAMSADAKYVYVNEEEGCKVHAFSWDNEAGTLTALHAPLVTLPEGVDKGHTAETALNPSGTRLYVNNRCSHFGLQDSIATFAVEENRHLRLVAHTDVGRHPRHWAIDPTGKWLLCTAVHDNRIDVFKLDEEGVPFATDSSLEVPTPTFCLFTLLSAKDTLQK